ncbi:SUKH-4 family immunity protein [Peribacillus frigoritolerans]|jgi:hypothetical protein|uniref:SUKH-4 family immunity protein n=1 Tax=Peribacillus TaxID=2675229 RepID=UPI003DA69B71
MISPQEFLNKWNSDTYGLVNYDESNINSFSITNETKIFLIKAGLPESAPPFLTFESSTNGGGIRLTEKNNSLGKMYDRFIYLGYTGSGNPVCINESNSEVVYIDYDNENNSVLINSTIAKFAESLLFYVEFIKKVKAVNGRRAYLEKNATKELLDWISKSLHQIDAVSLTQGGFWEEELVSFSE